MYNFKKNISRFLFLLVLIPVLNIKPLYSSPSHNAEEVIVVSLRNQRSFEQQPTRLEVLGGEEINEKANMKPGDIRMLLNEITGIHVQQTSPISFNSSIRIQGLNGKWWGLEQHILIAIRSSLVFDRKDVTARMCPINGLRWGRCNTQKIREHRLEEQSFLSWGHGALSANASRGGSGLDIRISSISSLE